MTAIRTPASPRSTTGRVDRDGPPAVSSSRTRDATPDRDAPRFERGGNLGRADLPLGGGEPPVTLGPGSAIVNTRALASSWRGNTPATSVGGVQLQGLELSAIERGHLELSFPLRAGEFAIPTRHADARARVADGGTVRLRVEIDAAASGEPQVTSATLRLEPPVTILNPASSLQPSSGPLGGLWDWIQDVAGDIHLRALTLRPDGSFDVDGTVDRPWPLGDTPLRDAIPAGTFPRLNLELRSLLEGQAIAEPATGPDEGTAPGLDTLLASLGALTEAGAFEAELQARATRLSVRAEGLELHSETAPIQVALDGRVRLDRSGVLRFELPDDPAPEVRSGAGSADLHGRLAVEATRRGRLRGSGDLVTRAAVDGVSGTIRPWTGASVPIEIRGADNIVVGKTAIGFEGSSVHLARGTAHADLRADLPSTTTLDITGTRLDLHGGTMRTTAGLEFDLEPAGMVVRDGTVDVHMRSRDAELGSAATRVRVGGGAEVRVHGERVRLDAVSPSPSAEGTLRFALTPDGFASDSTPMWGEVRYDLQPDGTLRLRPGDDGITEFVAPMAAVGGRPDNLVDPSTPAVGPVGSAALKAHLATLCASPLRPDNQVKLLVDGVMSREERLRLIRGATERICLQTLIFKEDESGEETVRELIAAAGRGVDVRVIVDALGNVENAAELTDGKPLYQRLRDGGVRVELYNDPRQTELGPLLAEALASPALAGDGDLDALLNDPVRALALLQHLGQVAAGRAAASAGTRASVATALERALDAADADTGVATPTVSSAALAAASGGDGARASEMLRALRLVALLNHRWHEKYLVVDGRAGVAGGMNIADEYMFGGTDRVAMRRGTPREGWRDTDIAVAGPAAADLQRAFARNWQTLTGEALPPGPAPDDLAIPASAGGGVELQVIQHRPRDDGDHHITNFMIENLKATAPGQAVYIANAYFLPTGALQGFKQALVDAARRGVEIHVVTNSAGTTDMPQVNHAALRSYEELLAAGVHIHERSGSRTMHTKAAVFAGRTAAVGSWNTDNRSASLNSEALVAVHDEAFGAQVEAMIRKDLAPDVAVELDLAEVRRRLREGGMRAAVAEMFADLM